MRRSRQEAKAEAAKRSELQDCTFQPKLKRGGRGGDGGGAEGGRVASDSSQSMYDRMQKWQARIDARVAEQQAVRKDKETEGCTFQPKVSRG